MAKSCKFLWELPWVTNFLKFQFFSLSKFAYISKCLNSFCEHDRTYQSDESKTQTTLPEIPLLKWLNLPLFLPFHQVTMATRLTRMRRLLYSTALRKGRTSTSTDTTTHQRGSEGPYTYLPNGRYDQQLRDGPSNHQISGGGGWGLMSLICLEGKWPWKPIPSFWLDWL